MYHGILLDRAFSDTHAVSDNFLVFARKISQLLGAIYGVEIEEVPITLAIQKLQDLMKADQPLYVHLYNETEVIVVFKYQYFVMSRDPRSWAPAIEYGLSLGIPKEQLNFKPNSFEDEEEYFC